MFAGILALPIPVGMLYGEFGHILSFVIPAGISGVLGFTLRRRFESTELRLGNAMVLVALTWIIISLIGGIPYVFEIESISLLDAFFESVAGFTATGLTILQGSSGWLVEVPSHSLLFWRSLTQWVGGVGVIVLFLAILPRAGKFSRLLYESEARSERMLPRIRDTAKFIWKVYIVFTLLGFLGFFLAGMDLFPAINHSMTGIATGGFSVTADSFASYNVPIVGVGIVLMIFGGISFVIHRKVFEGEWKRLFKSTEVQLGIALILISAIALAVYTGFKHGLFLTTSALTGTGFSTTGLIPSAWNSFQKGVLTLLMVCGGGYGSTSSAIKLIRIVIIMGSIIWLIKRSFLPDRAVVPLKIDGNVLKERDVMEAATYATLYIAFLVICSLAIMVIMPGQSGSNVLFESASAQGNVGLSVGITEVAPPSVQGILIFQMIAGRLEILPYIALVYSIYRRVRVREQGF